MAGVGGVDSPSVSIPESAGESAHGAREGGPRGMGAGKGEGEGEDVGGGAGAVGPIRVAVRALPTWRGQGTQSAQLLLVC